MGPLDLFLRQHALAHSAQVAPGEGEWSLEDEILKGLSDEQTRTQVDGRGNSLAWLIWHMARTEDVTMNVLLAGRPQVLHSDGWLERLGLDRFDIGTSMKDEEVGDFSSKVDIATLRAYRVAVGRRTREIATQLDPAELDQPVDPANIERLLSEGALAEGALQLAGFWGTKTKGFLLSMPATGHNFMHLGEAVSVRRSLHR